jgi:hypothetical protein
MESLVQEHRSRREGDKNETDATSAGQSPSHPSSSVSSDSEEAKAQKERDALIKADDPLTDHQLVPSYVSPYVKYMLDQSVRIGEVVTQMPKKELTYVLEDHWDLKLLGDPSNHLLWAMATFMRSPEAQKRKATAEP